MRESGFGCGSTELGEEMKKVLFICVENSCRSQMAEGFAGHFGKGALEAYSAGSRPGAEVNPLAVEVMGEVGIDILDRAPKGFSALPAGAIDHVVMMGCRDECPIVPATERIEWDIPDPKGKGIEVFRRVRDEIRRKVKRLVDEIGR